MWVVLKPLFYTVLLLFFFGSLSAQKEKLELYPYFGAGYYLGATISPNQENFIWGDSYHLGLIKDLPKGHQIGAGVGVQRAPRELFFPITVHLKLVPSPSKTLGFVVAFGYSPAVGEYEEEETELEHYGGFYSEIGARWFYELENGLRIKPQISFSRQISKVEYDFLNQPEIYIEQNRLALHIGLAVEFRRHEK